jgi:hypothetical protein
LHSDQSRPIAYWRAADQTRKRRFTPIIALMFFAAFASITIVEAVIHVAARLDVASPGALRWKGMAALVVASFGPMFTAFWIIHSIDKRTAVLCPRCEAPMIGNSIHHVLRRRRCPHCARGIVSDRRPPHPGAVERHRGFRERLSMRGSIDLFFVIIGALLLLEVQARSGGVVVIAIMLTTTVLYGAIRLRRPSRIIFAVCLLVALCGYLAFFVSTTWIPKPAPPA